MQLSSLFLLVASILFFPFVHAHSLVPKATINNCHNLDRLNNTVNRMSPLLERILHLDHDHAAKHSSGSNANSTAALARKRDLGDLIKKIQAMQGVLGESQGKISAKMLSCQEPAALSARDMRLRVNSYNKTVTDDDDSDSDSDSDDDDDDDDEVCDLGDVLESLVDTLECLLSFTFSLLDGVLDLVANLLGSILHLVGSLLD